MRKPNHLFHDAITLYTSHTLNDYGENVDGTGTSTTGRYVEKNIMIEDKKGQKKQADGLIQLKSSVTGVEVGQKVMVNSVDFRIMKIIEAKDGKGNTRKYRLIVKKTSV